VFLLVRIVTWKAGHTQQNDFVLRTYYLWNLKGRFWCFQIPILKEYFSDCVVAHYPWWVHFICTSNNVKWWCKNTNLFRVYFSCCNVHTFIEIVYCIENYVELFYLLVGDIFMKSLIFLDGKCYIVVHKVTRISNSIYLTFSPYLRYLGTKNPQQRAGCHLVY
jgi:hypothetical protein